MRNLRFIKKSITQFVFPKTNKEIISEIDTTNLLYLRVIAFVCIVIELARLCIMPFSNRDLHITPLLMRTIFCIIISAIVAVICTILKKKGDFTHLQVKLLVIISYYCWTTWGFLTSYAHFKAGEQIITFFTVLFVFVAFITMRFITSFILITTTFIISFIMINHTNHAPDVDMFNFVVMYLILLFASVLRYHFAVSQTKNRIRIMQMNDTLKNVSRYDYITQSRNRYALNNDLYKYVGKEIYIVVCDIDFLKFYNDKYGHVVGDKIISTVAMIEKEVFKGGHVYRYGGDEFIILGCNFDQKTVEEKLSLVKEKISNTHIEGVEESIFCSFGMVMANINSEAELEHYVTEADKILYNNKKTNHAIEKSILFKS